MSTVPWMEITSAFVKAPPIGDLVDRLHHTVVPAILSIFCLMISAKQWVGSPIQCWLPKEFSHDWNQYAEDYCFIHETYYAPIGKAGTLTVEQKKANSAGYYQWVPIFLVLSALFFYLPFFIYQHCMRKRASMDVQKYVEEAITIKNGSLKDRQGALNILVDDFTSQVQSETHKKNNAEAVWLYLLLKVVFCINVIAQIYHMNVFLGHESLWAVWSFSEMAKGFDWNYHGYFPRVTFCDFAIRDLGNTRSYSIQCVLMINMFNEKVYLFLWSLYVILFAVTVLNLCWTCYVCLVRGRQSTWIRSLLEDSDPKNVVQFEDHIVSSYTHDVLGQEALFILRLIQAHTDRRLCVLITRAVYDKTKDSIEKRAGDIDLKDVLGVGHDKKPLLGAIV